MPLYYIIESLIHAIRLRDFIDNKNHSAIIDIDYTTGGSYMSLENLYRKSLLPFRQHLLVARGIFRSSLRVLLYLAAIPFISYSFAYIYTGDGTMEALMSIPVSITYIVLLLNILVFMILIPFVMTITQRFIKNETFSAGEMLRSVSGRIFPLVLGFIALGFFASLLIAGFLYILPLFGTQGALILFSLAYFILAIYLYMNVLFWSHYVVLNGANTSTGFRSSRKLFKKFGKLIVLYTMTLAFLSLLVMNGLSLILSALITNAMAVNITLAFVQSLVLIYSQIMLTSFFLNFSLLGTEEKFPTTEEF